MESKIKKLEEQIYRLECYIRDHLESDYHPICNYEPKHCGHLDNLCRICNYLYFRYNIFWMDEYQVEDALNEYDPNIDHEYPLEDRNEFIDRMKKYLAEIKKQ